MFCQLCSYNHNSYLFKLNKRSCSMKTKRITDVHTIKSSFILILIVFTAYLFHGCGAVGTIIGGSNEQFTGHDIITLDTARADILDLIAQVGKELDLSVSALDQANQKIELSSGVSKAQIGLTGKISYNGIAVTILDSGKKLDVTILVQGNFGYGKKENADKLFNDFKAKIISKIK